MATLVRNQVVLDKLSADRTGDDMTHRTESVTKTATMTNGSCLIGDTEAAILNVATVDGVIDDIRIDDAAVGDVVLVRVAHSFCKFRTSLLHFSDAGAFVPANATVLNVLNQFA